MGNCIQEISADTLFIYERLQKTQIGEEVTYDELSKLIGRKVAPGMLVTARKKAMNDDQIVFGTIRNKGLKRLADSEVVSTAKATFLGIQRTTKRERRRLSSVKYEMLSKGEQGRHNGYAAALAMINEAAAPKQLAALEDTAVKNAQKLSMIQTIDAFREAEGGI